MNHEDFMRSLAGTISGAGYDLRWCSHTLSVDFDTLKASVMEAYSKERRASVIFKFSPAGDMASCSIIAGPRFFQFTTNTAGILPSDLLKIVNAVVDSINF